MKKIVTFVLSLVMAVSTLTGCTSTPAKPENTNESNVPGETTPSGKPLKVMLLIPGTLGDKSFFDSANAGLKLIEDEYGATTKVIEMGTDNTKFTSILEDVIAEGWDIIITGGINISQPLQEVAENYPDQKFMLYDEAVEFEDNQNSNIYCMTYRSYEGAYLAGALAALGTSPETLPKANDKDIIGFAGGFDIPLINDWLVGYIQGAQGINSDIKVGIGYMNSFTDAAKGKEIGIALYNSGADIVFQAAGGAGLGVLDAAKEKGAYAIGTDSDQSALFANDEEKANAILASILKRVDISIKMAIEEYINGTLEFGTSKSYGIAEGCIELTDNEWYQKNVPAEVREKVADINKKIASGEIQVKSAFEMTDAEVATMKEQVKP